MGRTRRWPRHPGTEQVLGGGGRDSKSDALGHAAILALADNEGVDPNHLALVIHQRAAGTAPIDGGISLNQASMTCWLISSARFKPLITPKLTELGKSPKGLPMAYTPAPDGPPPSRPR